MVVAVLVAAGCANDGSDTADGDAARLAPTTSQPELLPPLDTAAAQPADAGTQSEAHESGNDVAEAQSVGRPGLICIGDTCVEMPEDGWPIFPDEVEHPAHPDPHIHPEREPEPKPEPQPDPHTHPESRPDPEPESKPLPEPGSGPESEPQSERGPGPGSEPLPGPGSGPGSEPLPERGPEPGSELSPEPGPEPGSEPSPEPELKPLPPRPEDVCPEGRTLASHQREDYATWYCQATIPEPAGDPIPWPEPDTEHPSYQKFRTSWLSHPMDIEVGMVFYGPETGFEGIVVDFVFSDEFRTPLYYVLICWGEPQHFEYAVQTWPDGFTKFDIVDGFLPPYQEAEDQQFRMQVDNHIPLGPCAAEAE